MTKLPGCSQYAICLQVGKLNLQILRLALQKAHIFVPRIANKKDVMCLKPSSQLHFGIKLPLPLMRTSLITNVQKESGRIWNSLHGKKAAHEALCNPAEHSNEHRASFWGCVGRLQGRQTQRISKST